MNAGKSATATTIVTEKNTAKAVGSGNLDVFATPMMVALMEEAACNCLADTLEVGQSSVGTMIAVEHMSPSAIGATITATAVIEEVAGRKVNFSVTAHDGKTEIGKGTHTRFLIDAARFMAKLG